MDAAYSVEFLAWDEVEVNDELSHSLESLAWDRVMEDAGDKATHFESPVWDRITEDKE
jgi:hypothetical protein